MWTSLIIVYISSTVQVDEKGWRVVSSYLEMPQHHGKLTNPTKLPGSSDDPRSRQFDPTLHKSLNSELKYLYTAVTRAKCNLWIYDSDRKARLPMFDYWYKRDFVKVVQAQPSGASQGVYTLVFASNSTPEQWKAQGDNFKKKHLWEQAILCYQRAGPENEYLAKEARAYHLIQRARHQKPQLYLEAALNFLECDRLHHNLHYLNGAALCLRNSKPPKYGEAAKLFERLGENEKAAQSYLKGKDIDNYARLKENAGQHGDVVRALMGKPFMRKRDALAKSSEYERQGIELPQDLSTSELSYSCAKFYSERRDRDTLIEVLAYMPEVSRKVKFLKEAKLYVEAFETLVEKKEFKDAYRLASAQGGSKHGLVSYDEDWLLRGLKTAEMNKDEGMRASFVFQLAKVEYKQLQAKNQLDKVNSDVIKNLDTLLRKNGGLIKAQASLLLGMLKRDVSLCRTAWRGYHSLNHRAGELEAFNQIQQLASESDQSLLDVCHVAKETGNTLMKASDINKVVKEALSFYGLQKIGMYYYTPPGQDIWIGEPLMKCVCKSNKYDLDGMMKLEASDARDELAKHCQIFKNTWLQRFDLKKKLEPKLRSFLLHRQLWEHRHLLRGYSMIEVSAEALRDYLQTSVHLLELRCLREESTDGLIALLVSIFTPRVYIYLPQRIKEEHVTTVRRSVNSRSHFERFIKSTIHNNDSSDHVKVDSWLMAWRACCISEPDLKYLIDILQGLENRVNEASAVPAQSGERYEPPPGFIYWRKDKKFYHTFSFWLNSCVEIREKGRFLWASKLAIFYFLRNIAEHAHEYIITVMNVVDIVSVYCTGLLAMLTHMNALQNLPTSFIIPHLYESTVHLFSLMNSWKREDRWLLSACAEEVSSSSNLKMLSSECRLLLIRAFDLLLGTNSHAPHYSILKIGLKKAASTDATRQCLILALVLFGNLSMLRVCETREFHQKIQFLLKQSLSKEENIPEYVSVACKASMSPSFFYPAEVFKLVEKLLQDAKVDSTLARLVFKDKGLGPHGRVEIIPIHVPQKQHTYTSFTFDVPEFVEQEQAQLEPDSDFREQEEDMSMMLTGRALGQLSLLNPELIDPDMVSATFCNACGVPLKIDQYQMFSGNEEQGLDVGDSVPKELYHDHVRSEPHHSNVLLCKQYTAITSNKSGTELYPTLRQDLTSLLLDCQELKIEYGVEKLDRPIDIIQEELEKSELMLSELEESHNWRKAIHEISKMVDSMDRLLKQYGKLYSQVREYLKQSKTMLKETKEFTDGSFHSNLRVTVQDMEEDIERNVNQFMPSAERKEGASQIKCDMLGQMESNALLLLEKEQKQAAREQHEQAADDDKLSDEDAGSHSDEEISKKVNAKEAQERERQLKRERKAKRHHRK